MEPGETLEEAARRELYEETGLRALNLTLADVYSGPEFRLHYPDGFMAYAVGATFETREYTGAATLDDAGESAALDWFAPGSLPQPINDFNAAILRRVGLLG